MAVVRRILVLTCMAIFLATPLAFAQVTTGSIAGVATDASGAVLPGVTVTITSDRIIGGTANQVTDTAGAYRFDRLAPGAYVVKFELQGFRTVERPDVRISAAFVATINGKMEVGSLSETITVTGESPTVDVRSNVQQTVMNQEILEGIPTGRDPWSLAKLIPGVQVATYDVGGTQSMQQSSMSAHGSSTNDVSYNIDGATVNWPGGGGGAPFQQGPPRRSPHGQLPSPPPGLYRPQQQQQKKLREKIDGARRGDTVVTAGGIIHDMRCDGTEARGGHDVAEFDHTTPITVIASYEDGVHVLRPVGLPVEVHFDPVGDGIALPVFRPRRDVPAA